MKKRVLFLCLGAVGSLYAMHKKDKSIKKVESALQEQKSSLEGIEKEFSFVSLLTILSRVDLTAETSKDGCYSIVIRKSVMESVRTGSDETGWPVYEPQQVNHDEVLKDSDLLKKIQKLFADESKERLNKIQQQMAVLQNKK